MRTVSCPDRHLLVLSALHLPPVLLVFYLVFPLRTFLSHILNCLGEQVCIALHTSDLKTITMTKSNDSNTLFEQIRKLQFLTHTLLTGFYLGSKWWSWALNSDHLTLSFLPDLVAVSSWFYCDTSGCLACLWHTSLCFLCLHKTLTLLPPNSQL